MGPFDLAGLRGNLKELTKETEKAGFWDDPEKAQTLLKKKKSLETKVEKYEKLESGFEDIEELIELAEEMEDEEEANAIVTSFAQLTKELEELKLDTLLDEKYDHNNAIISIHAGTGGVDAMDWAEMLLRMYTRWAEKTRLQGDHGRPAGRYGGRHQERHFDYRRRKRLWISEKRKGGPPPGKDLAF